MPRVEVLNQLSMAPTRVGTTYAYHPLFVPIIELDRLPRKPRDEPCVRGLIVVPAGTRLTL
jgi:hypothetical protein